MEQLEIPTRAIEVVVRIDHGEPLRGELFATDLSDGRDTKELLSELLNDERQFVPFHARAPANGRVSLNKEHIVAVRERPHEDDDPADEFVHPGPTDSDETCSLLLTDGSRLEGRLRVATPWSSSRVLDKLNQAERFLQVVTPDGVSLVNGLHIVRVW